MSERYIVNVEGVVVRDGRYLMIVRGDGEGHAPGALSLPGGKVELAGTADAILERTLQREILEETGIVVDGTMEYIESKAFLTDTGEPVVGVVFLCRYEGGQPTVADRAEVAAIQWLSADQICQCAEAPTWTRQSIALAERKLRAARSG